jgi:hypothetical protein
MNPQELNEDRSTNKTYSDDNIISGLVIQVHNLQERLSYYVVNLFSLQILSKISLLQVGNISLPSWFKSIIFFRLI